MRLFEAIIQANHRAAGGDSTAGICPSDYAAELPVVALTCIDPRLNSLLPGALGLPGEQFIWLRNAGNIVTGPVSSTLRSLALACAVKGGKEIVILGHTDCQVTKTTTMQLLERMEALGVDRRRLPSNMNEFFGLFGSERQNVIKACEIVRQSPLIGSKVPVHGAVVDIITGQLEWIVNGYDGSTRPAWTPEVTIAMSSVSLETPPNFAAFNFGEMKFPEGQIGELTSSKGNMEQKVGDAASVPPPIVPPVVPLRKPPRPPPLRPGSPRR